MHRTVACVAGLLLAAGAAGPSQSAGVSEFAWICNIEGAPAQLTAQVEAISPAGVFMDPGGLFAGAIPTNEVNYYYQGTLVSASARYAFTGENQFADFVDLQSNERFIVQLIIQGQNLLMIVNPHGPQPVQYLCQMSARQ